MSDGNGTGQVTRASDIRKRMKPFVTMPNQDVYQLQRPGPEVGLKYGRLPQSLRTKLEQERLGLNEAEAARRGMEFIATLTEEEFAGYMLYARDMVKACMYKPRIVVLEEGEERELGDDELLPEELPAENFWYVMAWGVRGGENIPIRIGDSEVKVEDLESFRSEPKLPDSGESSEASQPELEPVSSHP